MQIFKWNAATVRSVYTWFANEEIKCEEFHKVVTYYNRMKKLVRNRCETCCSVNSEPCCCSLWSLGRHVAAINKLSEKGMFFWDYGNAFLLEAKRAGECYYMVLQSFRNMSHLFFLSFFLYLDVCKAALCQCLLFYVTGAEVEKTGGGATEFKYPSYVQHIMGWITNIDTFINTPVQRGAGTNLNPEPSVLWSSLIPVIEPSYYFYY